MEIAPREGIILGMDMGRPIVTNKELVAYCVKVREMIELPFEVLSEVRRGIDVLDGGPHLPRGRGSFGFFCQVV